MTSSILKLGNDEAISKLEYLLQKLGKMSVAYLKNHYMWRGFMENEKYRALVNNTKYQIRNPEKIINTSSQCSVRSVAKRKSSQRLFSRIF